MFSVQLNISAVFNNKFFLHSYADIYTLLIIIDWTEALRYPTYLKQWVLFLFQSKLQLQSHADVALCKKLSNLSRNIQFTCILIIQIVFKGLKHRGWASHCPNLFSVARWQHRHPNVAPMNNKLEKKKFSIKISTFKQLFTTKVFLHPRHLQISDFSAPTMF